MTSASEFFGLACVLTMVVSCSSEADDGTGGGLLSSAMPTGVAGSTAATAGSGGNDTGAGAGGEAGEGGSAGDVSGGAAGAEANVGEPGPDDPNSVWLSSGCGSALPEEQAGTVPGERTGYTQYSVPTIGDSVSGLVADYAQDRYFSVRVPFDYDPNTAYRTVYIGQGCGSDNMSGWQNTYQLFNEDQGGSEQAIYVSVSLPEPDKKSSPNGQCYDNRAGDASIEWEAFAAIHEFVESRFCVDNNRVHISGYSTGGWLANMWGCYFAGVNPARKFAPNFSIRGQAAVTGGLPLIPECGGPVAALWIHDQFDEANTIDGNLAARDRVLAVNGCSGSATEPWGVGEQVEQLDCQQYVDCPAEYPVVFCTSTDGGHTDQAARAVPAFTQFFEMMDAP